MATKKLWREARAKVERENRCRICRIISFKAPFGRLEAAHTIGQRHQDERLENGDKRVDPDSIIPLCIPCHQSYDTYKLSIYHLLTPEEWDNAVGAVGEERATRRTCNKMKVPGALT